MKSVDAVEVKEPSEIHEAMRHDTKEIVADLRGGVTMRREAASGSLASALFIVMLTLTAFHHGMFRGSGFGVEKERGSVIRSQGMVPADFEYKNQDFNP